MTIISGAPAVKYPSLLPAYPQSLATVVGGSVTGAAIGPAGGSYTTIANLGPSHSGFFSLGQSIAGDDWFDLNIVIDGVTAFSNFTPMWGRGSLPGGSESMTYGFREKFTIYARKGAGNTNGGQLLYWNLIYWDN